MSIIIKCLIVDDEPLSRDVLRKYINDHESLELVGESVDAIEAGSMLRNYDVQLIFLDINMPKLSGINFYKSLANKPAVIFTTAYSNYAVDGFELNATDYLVKPFGFDRFYNAIEKVLNNLDQKQSPKNDFITVKTDKKIYKVSFDQINYFESIGDYVKIHLDNKVLITSETLKGYERILPSQNFVRIHKSFIISMGKLDYMEGNQVQLIGVKLPVGKAYRDGIKQMLK